MSQAEKRPLFGLNGAVTCSQRYFDIMQLLSAKYNSQKCDMLAAVCNIQAVCFSIVSSGNVIVFHYARGIGMRQFQE